MIHLELQRNKAKTLLLHQNTAQGATNNMQKPQNPAAHSLLDTLEVTESRITDNNCDKVVAGQQTAGETKTIKCPSCEAWQTWSVESEHCILLIEKKLIERESVLQQKFKSLLKEMQNKSEAFEEKIHEYELAKTKDRKTIEYLSERIAEYHKEVQSTQTKHSFSSISPSNELISKHADDVSVTVKQSDSCDNLRTVKKEKEFVSDFSQLTKDKKKGEAEDKNMSEFKKKLRYNMGESTKNLQKQGKNQVEGRSNGGRNVKSDLDPYRKNGQVYGESLKIQINEMKSELSQPQASIERDIQQNSSLLVTHRNGEVATTNQTGNQKFSRDSIVGEDQQEEQCKMIKDYKQSKEGKETSYSIESLQQKQSNENNRLSTDRNGQCSISRTSKNFDEKFDELEQSKQHSQLLGSQSLYKQMQNVRKQSFTNKCEAKQSSAQVPIQTDVELVNQQHFNQTKSFAKENTIQRKNVQSNLNSLQKASVTELQRQFYSSDIQQKKEGHLEKRQKSQSSSHQSNNVECANDLKSIQKQRNGNEQKNNCSINRAFSNSNYGSNSHNDNNNNNNNSNNNNNNNINGNQHRTLPTESKLNHINSIHSFCNSPVNTKTYAQFEPHRRNESCNEKYGKQQSSTSDISQRWKSMPEQQVCGDHRVIRNVHEYNKKIIMEDRDSKSIFSQQTYAYIPKQAKEGYANQSTTGEVQANSKYFELMRHEDKERLKTKMIQQRSQKQSISSLSHEDSAKSNDGMKRHNKIMTFNAGVESICRKGVNGSAVTYNSQAQQLSSSKQNDQKYEGKTKSELSQTLGSIGKATKFGESTNNTFKTIKLNNNVDSGNNHVFHKTAPNCSLTREMKNRNNQFAGIGDKGNKIWQQSGEEASVSNWGNPEYGGDRLTRKAREGQDQSRMKFENENLKSYNRVLLDKLAHSRPRMY